MSGIVGGRAIGRGGRSPALAWRAAFGALAVATAAWLLRDRAHAARVATPGFPPFDTLKPLADGLHTVDAVLPGLAGRLVGARMTVVQLPDRALLLYSPTRWTAALGARLAAIGPVRHLVAPNPAHWLFLRDWQRACPDAVTWAAPGVASRRAVRRAGIRIDRALADGAPAEWDAALDVVVVPATPVFAEAVLHHRATATLLLADLADDLPLDRVPPLFRPLVTTAGMVAPDRHPPPQVRGLLALGGERTRDALARVLALPFRRVVLAHGPILADGGPEVLRRAWRGLVASPATPSRVEAGR